MAKTANLYVRIEREVKEEAESILESLGIPVSSAINMYFKQIILQRGIPFAVKLPSPSTPDPNEKMGGEYGKVSDDAAPIDRFVQYLAQPSEWEVAIDSPMTYYYRNAPEFSITRERVERINEYEYYLFGQVNLTPTWWDVTLKYCQTALERYTGISLDGENCFVMEPCIETNLTGVDVPSVAYFVKDSIEANLLAFFKQRETVEERSFRAFMKGILEFKSEHERECFVEYVNRNPVLFQKLYVAHGEGDLPFFSAVDGKNPEEYMRAYKDALVIKELLQKFRRQQTG